MSVVIVAADVETLVGETDRTRLAEQDVVSEVAWVAGVVGTGVRSALGKSTQLVEQLVRCRGRLVAALAEVVAAAAEAARDPDVLGRIADAGWPRRRKLMSTLPNLVGHPAKAA